MRKLLLILVIPAFFMACVSTGSPKQAPGWILQTPGPDATYTYFVGSSSDSAGNASRATEDAAAILLSEITRYMGVKVSVETDAVARGSLDEYSAQITATLTQKGSSNISGFKVVERYQTTQPDGSIAVYILASYNTKDLEKEKARIASLFREQEDAVAIPEAAGDAAASAGRYFDAIKSYIEAAVAASGSDIDNAQIKMERNTNKARAILAKIRFVKVDAPTIVNLGKDYPKAFSARLVFGEGDNAPGIPSAEVYAVYQRMQTSGRLVTRTERVLTDERGIATFTPPAADFVGKATFVFNLNLDSTKTLLDRFPAQYNAYSDAIYDDMGRRTISFPYTVESQAKNIATGIVILDLNDSGSATGGTVAQGGLFETLVKEKFKVGLAPVDNALIIAMDDARILASAKSQYGAALGRLIYGTARITEVRKDGSMWQATGVMAVRCVDFATGSILYSAEKTTIAIATDEASARRSALLQLGRDAIAKDIMVNLP